jgi:hypothetical protein
VAATTARYNPTWINTDVVGAANLNMGHNVTCKKPNEMSL